MKTFNFVVLFLLICFVSFNSAHAQDQEAMMQAWMEYMTPGKAHEMMAKNVGEWETEAKLWMDPSMEPSISKGTATFEMILGGRYLTSKHVADIPAMQMTMEGMTLEAYDNKKEEVVSIWIDNMGTGIMVGRGKYDAETNTLNISGTYVDPLTGNDIPFREVVKFIDDNNYVMEMYSTMNGEEIKNMEVKYTRK